MAKYTFMDKIWFANDTSVPVKGVKASKNIGAGENGVITIKYDDVGTDGNAYSVEVVEQVGNNLEMSATLADGVITVTLGTDGAGDNSVTSNTAILIAAAISEIDGFTATASGTGETALVSVVAETALNGGQFATPVHTPAIMIINDVVYVAETGVMATTEGGWKTGSLS